MAELVCARDLRPGDQVAMVIGRDSPWRYVEHWEGSRTADSTVWAYRFDASRTLTVSYSREVEQWQQSVGLDCSRYFHPLDQLAVIR
jgi:hypothetical protein